LRSLTLTKVNIIVGFNNVVKYYSDGVLSWLDFHTAMAVFLYGRAVWEDRQLLWNRMRGK